MKGMHRRQRVRYDLQIPLSVQRLGLPLVPPFTALSSNVSASGVCFCTTLPLKVGMPVQITLMMPGEVTGDSSSQWHCWGQVVRLQPKDFFHQEPSVGVKFHYYQAHRANSANSTDQTSGESLAATHSRGGR